MTEKGRKFLSGAIRTILKLAVAAAVMIWFCRSFDFNAVAAFSSFNYSLLIPAFFILIFTNIAASLRWRALADTINVDLTPFRAFSLTMQGLFFSLVIPGGSIGGDVVKMAAITGHVKQGSRTEGIFSIVMDRIVGMIALFAIALALLIINRTLFAELKFDDTTIPMAGTLLWWIFTGTCSAGLLVALVIFIHRLIEKLPGIKQLMSFADQKSNGKITRLSNAADSYASSGRKITFWVVITIFFIHLTPALSMFLLLYGTGAVQGFSAVVPAVIIGNIAGLVPLFPGGIGARDTVTIALLAAAGCPVQHAAAAQLLSTAVMILFNLTGSLFFIFDRKTS